MTFYAPTDESRTETDAAIAAGIATVQPTPVPEDPALYILNDGTVVDLHPHLEKYGDAPLRKTGARTTTDVDSFVGYLHKHAEEGTTELWADAKAGTVLAVVNAHQGAVPGWGDHTAQLRLPYTDDWRAWVAKDGEWFGQSDFAEFIQDHLTNFVSPDGATMLEMAESFRSTTRVDFDSSRRVSSGETQLVYRENIDATAGRAGQLTIPDGFQLGLQVHERGQAYAIGARFRYRIHDKSLRLGYKLDRPGDVLNAAFGDVTEKITDATGHAVWHGTPNGTR